MKYYAALMVASTLAGVGFYSIQDNDLRDGTLSLSASVVENVGVEKEAQNFTHLVSDSDEQNVEVGTDEESGYAIKNDDSVLDFLSQENAQGRRYVSEGETQQSSDNNIGRIVQLKGASFSLDPDHIPHIDVEREYVYVQLKGGVTAEARRQLSAAGAELAQYVGSNTWLANVSGDQIEQLARSSTVFAVGERDLKDKLSPVILKLGVKTSSNNDSRYALVVEVLEDKELIRLKEILISEHLVESEGNISAFGQTSLLLEITPDKFEALVRLDIVSWIENIPAEDITTNVVAAALSKVDVVRDSFALTGSGVVLGMWDSGEVDDHTDLTGRVTNHNVSTGGGVSSHSTHVAGTILGSGLGDNSATGMAPAATLNAYDSIDDSLEMRNAANSKQVVISNHSYGPSVGWSRIFSFWIFENNQEDFGRYDVRASEWDDIVDDTDLVIVKSAGNDRGQGPVTPLESAPIDGADTGYDTIPTFANAKNIITVGATTDAGGMTNFSGWGPADDGRIKPDIVANGFALMSTDVDNGYIEKTGTSMAAPVVTGALALLYERFDDIFELSPEASMVKAILLHTADDLGDVGPDFEFGWGLMNLENAVNLIDQGTRHVFYRDISNSAATTLSFTVAPGEASFKLTMVWTDPRAASSAANALINDLDVRLISPSGVEFFPWVKDGANPADVATKGDNQVDNIEQIVIENPESGVWTSNITGSINQGDSQRVSIASSINLSDVDSDNDWLSDEIEIEMGTNPSLRDSDGDDLTDYQEVCFDGDCSSYSPYSEGRDTDANNADTDGDGINDGDEVESGRNPLLNEAVLIVIINSLLL